MNNFLDVKRIEFRKYINNEMIPLIGNNFSNSETALLPQEIKLENVTMFGNITNTMWINNYFEILMFRYQDLDISCGINDLIMKQTYKVYHNNNKTKIEFQEHNLNTISVDMFIYRKEINKLYPKFWDMFYFKDDEYKKIVFDPSFQKQLNTINFNHIISTILDFFNLSNVTEIKAEDLEIHRTKNKFNEAVLAKEEQIYYLYEMLGKNLNKMDLINKPKLILLDDSAKNQILDLYKNKK